MKSATWLGWAPTMVISAVMLALLSPAAAADTAYERATLVGLTGVGVFVERMDPTAEKGGLAQSTLQTDVELKLRQAGIRVLGENEYPLAPGSPRLYLRVSTFRLELPLYAFDITLGLYQAVRLLRDPSIVIGAATWETNGRIGTVGENKLSTLRERARDEVDKFINAYLAANPQK
jgi:hypothetical protein